MENKEKNNEVYVKYSLENGEVNFSASGSKEEVINLIVNVKHSLADASLRQLGVDAKKFEDLKTTPKEVA